MQTKPHNKSQRERGRDPLPAKELVNHQRLAHLMSKAKRISHINHLVQSILTGELARHCRVINITYDRITLAASSSVWATRMRLTSRELLSSLHYYDDLTSIKNIDCHVRPFTSKTLRNYSQRKAKSTLSKNTKGLLKNTADNIEHPALKNALTRLAREK